jgi:hypothetical protein
MNSSVERTRPALTFVDIDIALRDRRMLLLSTKSWELQGRFVTSSLDHPVRGSRRDFGDRAVERLLWS